MKKPVQSLLAGVFAAAPLLAVSAARAGSEESTAERLILPLVVEGRERASEITFSNGTNTPITVRSTYFGATGTPLAAITAGGLKCDSTRVEPLGATSVALSVLCPRLRTTDAENRGYLRIEVDSDRRAYIGASIVTTTPDGARFRVDAEPLGAHDIAAPIVLRLGGQIVPLRDLRPLEVEGVEGEVLAAGVINWRAAGSPRRTAEKP
jgi:hypothetical protein